MHDKSCDVWCTGLPDLNKKTKSYVFLSLIDGENELIGCSLPNKVDCYVRNTLLGVSCFITRRAFIAETCVHVHVKSRE